MATTSNTRAQAGEHEGQLRHNFPRREYFGQRVGVGVYVGSVWQARRHSHVQTRYIQRTITLLVYRFAIHPQREQHGSWCITACVLHDFPSAMS